MPDKIPKKRMLTLAEVEPVTKELDELNDSLCGRRSITRPRTRFVRGIRAKHFDLQTVDAEKPKREGKLGSQAVVLHLRGQPGKLPDRIEIKLRRINSVSAQQVRLLLPAREQRRILQPRGHNRVNTACDHQHLTIL